jgi:hypothetical protein
MKKSFVIGAVMAAVVGIGSSALADATCNQNQLTNANFTTQTVVGEASVACFRGGSGNEVSCDTSGNLVKVTKVSTVQFRFNNGGNPVCEIAGSASNTCSISRTKGVGGIDPDWDYCS